MEIHINPDCENAPEKAFIRDFNIAFAQADFERLSSFITEEIVWDLVGEKRVEGIKAFQQAMEEMKEMKLAGLTLHQILTHGKEGAAHGEFQLEDGNTYAYAEFYIFNRTKGHKIRSVMTFATKIS